MGDISVIARRLEGGKRVQYGWSGNGGYYRNVGGMLLCWYDDPQMVEYLFGLGQMRYIGKPESENGGEAMIDTHIPEGRPHWLGKSEREIFSKIAFVDFGYFYDLDDTWYYVIPGPFRIKIPLWYIHNNLDEQYFEFDTRRNIETMVISYILTVYYNSDKELQSIVNKKYTEGIEAIRKAVLSSDDRDFPCLNLFKNYRLIFNYFDDWILVKTNEQMTQITDIIVQKRQKELETSRIETINW